MEYGVHTIYVESMKPHKYFQLESITQAPTQYMDVIVVLGK